MRTELQYGQELNAETASLMLPRLAKQIEDYDGCHRWFYARNKTIFSLHEDSQTLALLTNATEDIDTAHLGGGYNVGGDVVWDIHGAVVSYFTKEAFEVIKEVALMNSPEVKEAREEVATTKPEENGLELF
jgi:hypothetical protein